MRSPFRWGLGLLFLVGGPALFAYGLYELMETGTCASGGPYVSARECPDGTGWYVAMLPVGILLAFVGIFVTPWSWAALVMWSAIFVGSGLVALYSAFGPDSPGEAGEGTAIFLAALFIPMGLFPVAVGLFGRSAVKERRKRKAGPSPLRTVGEQQRASYQAAAPATPRPARPTAPVAGTDPVEQLRKLGELRDSGVLTPAEFESAKARLLAEI